MRMLFILSLLIALIPYIMPFPVTAHVLTTDNTVGAIIHVTPDDDPIIGEPAEIFFEFKDTDKTFSLAECLCTVTIKAGKEVLYTQELTPHSTNALSSASLQYAFPQKNNYTVVVEGKPKDEAFYKPFSLSFELNVTRERSQQTESLAQTASHADNSWLVYLTFALVLAGALTLVYMLHAKKGKQ